MNFTYDAYKKLVNTIRGQGYEIANYHNYKSYDKTVILRHDIDFSLERAVEFAILESSINVKSTYFILIRSDFYNPMSKKSLKSIRTILDYGHDIGLHFDEMSYSKKYISERGIETIIMDEVNILSEILKGYKVKSVSMHRPSQETLSANYKFDNLVNSYSKEFFNNFKYLSDSRMTWRENVEQVIKNKKYNHIQILTHPFWYKLKEKSRKEIIEEFLNSSNSDRYNILNDNITDLDSILKENM